MNAGIRLLGRYVRRLLASNDMETNAIVTYERVKETVGRLPYILRPNAKMLYDFIVEHEVRHVLETGVAHGVASCFIAAALQEVGRKTKAQSSALNAPPPRFGQRISVGG